MVLSDPKVYGYVCIVSGIGQSCFVSRFMAFCWKQPTGGEREKLVLAGLSYFMESLAGWLLHTSLRTSGRSSLKTVVLVGVTYLCETILHLQALRQMLRDRDTFFWLGPWGKALGAPAPKTKTLLRPHQQALVCLSG